MKITDNAEKRWEAPLYNPDPGNHYSKVPMTQMGFDITYAPYQFTIYDIPTQTPIVSTEVSKGGSLIFYDKFLEFGLWLPSHRIFGLGERVTQDFELCNDKKNCTYTIFTRDEGSPLDDGTGGKNIYGAQPFYMVMLPTHEFMGILSLNSNNQDANITKLDQGKANVYHKMTGGILDMYFFYPSTSEQLLQKYHDLIGRPYVPPFWSLGFHMCRYGWKTLNDMKEVVAKFEQADIPLEAMWADIDYMHDYADFTIDPINFNGLSEFVDTLHSRKMKWVPIIDAGLKYDPNDKYFIMGEEKGAFIKSAYTGTTLIGAVWPGSAVFLSWYSPDAMNIWHVGLQDFYNQVKFDGIWLDMNEVSNFCPGECPDKENMPNIKSEYDPNHDPTEFDDLPYYPGGHDPREKTVSMTGYHYSTNEDEDRLLKEHNTHSLWGTMEVKATYRYFIEKQLRRPFILTRSNFPGTGMFTSKWLGDNTSSWDYLRYSIIGVYNYQLFGIPHIGADICGFFSQANEELCARWMQLGAFYPFSRNHHGGKGQEPYFYGESVATTSRNALRQRYSILRYLHTKLFEVSLFGGSTIRPSFFEFPLDGKAYYESGKNFMIGNSLLVAPVLEAGHKFVEPYLPNDDWFDLFKRTKLMSYNPDSNNGKSIKLDAGFDFVNVLIRSGSIVPFQDAIHSKIRRTETLKYLPMEIIVVPNYNGVAAGTLIIDDDEAANPIHKKCYHFYNFTFDMQEKAFTSKIINNYLIKPMPFENFNKLTIFGAEKWKNVNTGCIYTKTSNKIPLRGIFDNAKNTLSFTKSGVEISWLDIITIKFDSNC